MAQQTRNVRSRKISTSSTTNLVNVTSQDQNERNAIFSNVLTAPVTSRRSIKARFYRKFSSSKKNATSPLNINNVLTEGVGIEKTNNNNVINGGDSQRKGPLHRVLTVSDIEALEFESSTDKSTHGKAVKVSHSRHDSYSYRGDENSDTSAQRSQPKKEQVQRPPLHRFSSYNFGKRHSCISTAQKPRLRKSRSTGNFLNQSSMVRKNNSERRPQLCSHSSMFAISQVRFYNLHSIFAINIPGQLY